jgi:hypothetical protein
MGSGTIKHKAADLVAGETLPMPEKQRNSKINYHPNYNRSLATTSSLSLVAETNVQ